MLKLTKYVKPAAVCVVSLLSFNAKADCFKAGLNGNVGWNFMGGIGLPKLKETTVDYDGTIKKWTKQTMDSFVWDGGVFVAYDFGDEGEEMLGAKLAINFFMSKTSLVEDKKGVVASSLGINIPVQFVWNALYFDGGNVFLALGPEVRLAFSNDLKNGEGKDFIDGKSEDLKKGFGMLDFAGRLDIGGEFVGKMISASIVTKFYFMDRYKVVDTLKSDFEALGIDSANVSLKGGLDVCLNIGFNFIPLFA